MKNLLSNKKVWLIRLGLLVLPLAASAQRSLENIVSDISGILGKIISLLFIIVTLYFLWGVIEYILAFGDAEKIKVGKQHMIWGIIGMAVMAGAWGIVQVVINFFGVTGGRIPTGPGQL